MAGFSSQGQAFNQTRQAYLATSLSVADTHWTRLRGLLGLRSSDFRNGCGLWIVPCHGVHTLGMGFPIDVVYLDQAMTVIHIQRELQPWRFAPIRTQAASVLELPCHAAAETGTALGDKIEIRIEENSLVKKAITERTSGNNVGMQLEKRLVSEHAFRRAAFALGVKPASAAAACGQPPAPESRLSPRTFLASLKRFPDTNLFSNRAPARNGVPLS